MFLFLRSSTYPVRDHLPRCVFPKSTERERERKIEREREKCGGCAPMSAALVSISVRLPRGGREGGAARCVWLKERDRARGWERERENPEMNVLWVSRCKKYSSPGSKCDSHINQGERETCALIFIPFPCVLCPVSLQLFIEEEEEEEKKALTQTKPGLEREVILRNRRGFEGFSRVNPGDLMTYSDGHFLQCRPAL